MYQTLIDRLVDKRNGRIQKLDALILIARRQRRPQLLDLRAKLAAIAPIDLVSLNVLTNSLFC
jgi:hypothetical protein